MCVLVEPIVGTAAGKLARDAKAGQVEPAMIDVAFPARLTASMCPLQIPLS